MSALTTPFVTNLLNNYFVNLGHANIGDAAGLRGSVAAGSLYYALHTADPGDAGNQGSSEVAYTGYARASAIRSSAGFIVSGKNVSPAVELSFGKRTDVGSATIYFWSLGTAASGAGNLILRGGIGTAPRPFTGATSDTLSCPAHGLVVGDPITFWQYESVALPGGITEGIVYFVKTVADADSFTVSATLGGGVLDVTSSGQGTCQKLTPLVVTQNVTPKLETGTVIKFQ
ncbi:MAG TPA: hypothetical protein VER11_12380 [Polyangiaceae bacterium]|nr:hypothetical protein [Polyangiaceae bacterium]